MVSESTVRSCDAVGCGEGSVQRYLDCRGPTATTFWVCSMHAGRLEAGVVPVVVPLPSDAAAPLLEGVALRFD